MSTIPDWDIYELTYGPLGPRFSFRGPADCFLCGKRIKKLGDEHRMLVQVMDGGPCGNAHPDCLHAVGDTAIIAKRFAEALAAAASGKKEKPHPIVPRVSGRKL